jgi:hypothetical protein
MAAGKRFLALSTALTTYPECQKTVDSCSAFSRAEVVLRAEARLENERSYCRGKARQSVREPESRPLLDTAVVIAESVAHFTARGSSR